MGSIATSNGNKRMTPVETLRSMLADPEKFIACPGVYDGFTAQIALREGVDCLYMVSQFSSLIFVTIVNDNILDWRRHNNVLSRASRHGCCNTA
jgi:hypothetical protein